MTLLAANLLVAFVIFVAMTAVLTATDSLLQATLAAAPLVFLGTIFLIYLDRRKP